MQHLLKSALKTVFKRSIIIALLAYLLSTVIPINFGPNLVDIGIILFSISLYISAFLLMYMYDIIDYFKFYKNDYAENETKRIVYFFTFLNTVASFLIFKPILVENKYFMFWIIINVLVQISCMTDHIKMFKELYDFKNHENHESHYARKSS